jgi:hypothetical protein
MQALQRWLRLPARSEPVSIRWSLLDVVVRLSSVWLGSTLASLQIVAPQRWAAISLQPLLLSR